MTNQLLRGLILEFLYRIYPNNIEKLNIIEVFYRDYKPKDIDKALEYLKDKGYIEKIEIQHPIRKFEKIITYKITPSGIDILDKTREDIGIKLYEGD